MPKQAEYVTIALKKMFIASVFFNSLCMLMAEM